jgi:hypothetical protein
LLHIVGINSFECMKIHGLTNPKFVSGYYINMLIIERATAQLDIVG